MSAANTTTTLNPGGTVDTGNHTWTLDDFRHLVILHLWGKIRVEQAGHLYQPMILELIREIQVHGSLLMGEVDMTQPLSLGGSTYAASAGWFGTGSGSKLGDANGVLLTNLSSSQLSGGSNWGEFRDR